MNNFKESMKCTYELIYHELKMKQHQMPLR